MRDPHIIIEIPLLTEKSNDQASRQKYHFRVKKDANKIEIAHAIETIYSEQQVTVTAVNTLNIKGKKGRVLSRGAKAGYSPSWKKAIVTTNKPLELFEGI